MSRYRTPLLVLGLVGALVVMVAVVLVIRLGRGTPVEVPVAIQDIPPGTPLDPRLFRLEYLRGLSGESLSAYVTAGEFREVMGLPVVETVHAGAPLLKAQVQTEAPNGWQSRLTLLLSDPEHLVFPLPVDADQVGNYIVAGDYVDVVFTLGRVAAQEMVHTEVVTGPTLRGVETELTPTVQLSPSGLRPGQVVTRTLQLPLAKVILPDVRVLRVEREQVQTASSTYGVEDGEARQAIAQGNVIRVYLEVDRQQAEVLSFALHNGAIDLLARAQPAGGKTEGFTWDDFVERFFRDRPPEWGAER